LAKKSNPKRNPENSPNKKSVQLLNWILIIYNY
jgi:hypothetical protein